MKTFEEKKIFGFDQGSKDGDKTCKVSGHTTKDGIIIDKMELI